MLSATNKLETAFHKCTYYSWGKLERIFFQTVYVARRRRATYAIIPHLFILLVLCEYSFYIIFKRVYQSRVGVTICVDIGSYTIHAKLSFFISAMPNVDWTFIGRDVQPFQFYEYNIDQLTCISCGWQLTKNFNVTIPNSFKRQKFQIPTVHEPYSARVPFHTTYLNYTERPYNCWRENFLKTFTLSHRRGEK